jgi:glycosyltransferase involved in cell wall biosynthesis
MRFAILGSRGFPSTYGGYETLVRYLARHLVSEGHETTVYCRSRDESRRSWVTEDVRCVATWGRDTKSLSTLTYGMTSVAHASLARYDAALVLNIANGYWLPALKAARIPFAVNTDGIEWERGKWSTLGKAVFRGGASFTARFADELIADSEAIAARWEALFGRTSTFIPYGAPVLEDMGRDRLEAVPAAAEPYVLVVARLAPENNVELTLDAIELLGDRAPNAIVVGSANFDSPIEHRLRALEDRGVVSWLGHVDDQALLMQLWAHSAVYVHGHSVGGTNPALLQALGAGAPTLALDTPYSREVLREDRQLFPADPRVLARRIEQVAASSDLQDQMRRAGQEIVRQRYSWPDVCRRYTDVLMGLAGAAAPPSGSRSAAPSMEEREVA